VGNPDNVDSNDIGPPTNNGQPPKPAPPLVTPAPEPNVSQKRSGWKKYIIGLAAFAIITLLLLGIGVYLAFSTIRTAVESASLGIPIPSEPPVSNQIAFIGTDFNVWLVAPDGSDRRRVTNDGRGYRFPTWAPDGRQLGFIGRDDQNNSVLYVAPTTNGEPSIVFNDPESSPFYLYWSPDSRAITFLTQETTDMAMRLVEPGEPESDRIIATGAPFYWVWSPTSDKMLLHVNGSRSASNNAHISLHDYHPEAERVELDLAPGQFQTPVWSSDGQSFFYIAENSDGGDSIFKTGSLTLEKEEITDLDGYAQMVLSPDDRHLAFIQYESGTRPPFGRAYLVDTESKSKERLSDNLVASMYWSPDGTKLAILSLSRPTEGPTAAAGSLAAPLAQEVTLRWWIYQVENKTLEPLISFEPTISFLQTVPYFDQYHLSLTFWSPDSRYLVVTKQEDNRPNAGTIWVVDTTEQEEPLKVGDGSLAVWSWQ
jgi:TolB protein